MVQREAFAGKLGHLTDLRHRNEGTNNSGRTANTGEEDAIETYGDAPRRFVTLHRAADWNIGTAGFYGVQDEPTVFLIFMQ